MNQRRNKGEHMKKKLGFHIVKKKEDPTEEIEQIVALTNEGYRIIFESPNK